MRVLLAQFVLGAIPLLAGSSTPARDYANELKSASLDAQECYRVRDITLVRDEVRIYLTDGYLIFGKAIAGRRHSAVFTAETESGDAEILLMPPHRSERRSLARFAHTPNLDEHIALGIFLFTDGTADELAADVQRSSAQKMPEVGALLSDKWNSLIRNLTASFEIRLVSDALSERKPQDGFFFGALSGKQLGNFDLIFDPTAREQITIGQVTSRNNRTFFDVWTSFVARSWRMGRRTVQSKDVDLTDFRIEADLRDDLHLDVVTKVKAKILAPVGRALAFDISRQMDVTDIRIDGRPAESFMHGDSLRANLLRGTDNELFLAVAPADLQVGKTYELEFHHNGDVITNAGKNVYFVGARGGWYPNRGADFARYDLTFRYTKSLDLVATGDIVDDREEGNRRITRRRTAVPIRFAGFNLGDYEKAVEKRGGLTIEVYANRRVESALSPKPKEVFIVPPPLSRSQPRSMTSIQSIAPPDSRSRLHEIATDVAGALEFMSQQFGPPPLKTLTVSPIPGMFGQGFPGLLYVSTLAYLDPKERPASARTVFAQTFYSEMLDAHETAHQWWGNLVTSASYQDDWLMEALANYSALLYMEKRKGRKSMETLLDQYKGHLLAKTEDGPTVESVGPIVWGGRLYSSQAPEAWRIITYEKGSWILHMLRGRMGDDGFLKMLGQLVARYQYKSINTDQFRQLAAEFMPKNAPDAKLESFFEQWVYGTGIPAIRMTQSFAARAPGGRVRGVLTQSDVDEDFSTYVPVEVQLPGKRTIMKWVQTSSEPVPFTVDVKQAPTKVQLDPAGWTLAVRK